LSNTYPINFAQSNLGEPEPQIPIENFHNKHELPDGSVTYDISDGEEDEQPEERDEDFYENLANHLSDEKLNRLAETLLGEIKQDIDSRSQWQSSIDLALKYAGFEITEFRGTLDFQGACSAFDATLSSALFRGYSVARAELFPAMGPAKCEVIGVPSAEIEDQGERVKMFMNYFLTQVDKDYYQDSERLLIYTYFFGCAFRKVYQDPITNLPCARFVRPQDFIIDNNTRSILSSSRMTEIVYLSRREIMLMQRSGDFIEMELPETSEQEEGDSQIQKRIDKIDGVDKGANENKSLFKFYEVHVELDRDDIEDEGKKEKGNDIPKPYVVKICESTRKIVSIRRNWKEKDKNFKRSNYFVNYYYLPSFGIYSFGLAQLLGSNAIAATAILRQLIDKGTLNNFPGGLKDKSFKAENNNILVGPTTFVEIDTGGQPLANGIMMMPYSEPSQVLAALRKEIKDECATLSSSIESKIPELGANAPVGTTVAMLEVINVLQSTVLRSQHYSLGQELSLLFDLFGEYLEDGPYPFSVPGKEMAVMRQDFNDKINIVPVSDPNVLTTVHRLIRNEALLKLANSAPQLHDMREAFHRMYSAMNVENIDKLLPPPPEPQSMDPISENMIMLTGKPVKVEMFQDDASHIVAHKKFISDPQVQANPPVLAEATIHMQRHEANKAFKEMYFENSKQQIESQAHHQLMQAQNQAQNESMFMIGQGMSPQIAQHQAHQKVMMNHQQIQQQVQQQLSQIQPPQMSPEEEEKIPLMPEIQNKLASNSAQEIMKEMEEQAKQQAEAANQLDLNKVAMADVEQRREASYLKDEETKLRAETEAFKAQLKYESEMAKTESQKEIASEKNEVDLAIEYSKTPT
jgi:hypothetical protein